MGLKSLWCISAASCEVEIPEFQNLLHFKYYIVKQIPHIYIYIYISGDYSKSNFTHTHTYIYIYKYYIYIYKEHQNKEIAKGISDMNIM